MSTYPRPGDNYAVVDLKSVGVRAEARQLDLQFAINTFGERAHPNYPAEFDVYIDTNGDGDRGLRGLQRRERRASRATRSERRRRGRI